MNNDRSSLPAWFEGLGIVSFLVAVGGAIYAFSPPKDLMLAVWYAVAGGTGGLFFLGIARVLTVLEQIRDASVITARASPLAEERAENRATPPTK